MDPSAVFLNLLISATLAFLILFVIFIVIAVDIKERRSARQRIGALEDAFRVMFLETPPHHTPENEGRHVWVSWNNSEQLQQISNDLLTKLLDTARCCNLSNVGAGAIVCAVCGHTDKCRFLVPHADAISIPAFQELERNGKL